VFDQGRRHRLREAVAIDGQRAARRNLVFLGDRQDQRSAPPHLLVQQSDGVELRVVGAEGVRTHHLRQTIAGVSLRRPGRTHLRHHDRNPGVQKTPSGLRSGETAADDVNGDDVGHEKRLRMRRGKARLIPRRRASRIGENRR